MPRISLTQQLKNADILIVENSKVVVQLRRQLDQAQQALKNLTGESDRQRDEIGILLSDRDRLTATLEVCTRRLASPEVEKMGDRRRAGWRAESLLQTVADNPRG